MLTNNFRKILFKVVFGLKTTIDGYPPTDASSYSSLPRLTSISGTGRDIDSSAIFQNAYASIINSLSTINTGAANGRGYIILGTGTTEPTPEDYRLESQITTNLSCDSVSVSRNTTVKTYTATFSNSGTSDMIVTEIGYVSRLLHLYNLGDYLYDNFLMDRTVLDTPVTIPAGESRTITYTLSF